MPWENFLIVTLVNLALGAAAFLVSCFCSLPAGIVLGIWAAIYIVVMFRFFRKHWNEMNRLGAEGAEMEERSAL